MLRDSKRTQLSLIGEDILLGDRIPIASTQVPRIKSEWKDHWHTPHEGKVPVIEMVIKVFGQPIDLDPCTDETNPTGAQRTFYLPHSDGLLEKWHGENVFINPPFSAKAAWLAKAAKESQQSRPMIMIAPSAVLHNKSTRSDGATATAIAPLGRVAFVASQKLQQHRIEKGLEPDPGAPPDNMTLLYWGNNPQRFAQVMREYGYWAYPGALQWGLTEVAA